MEKKMSLKFKVDLPNEVKEHLEREYREFVKITPMTSSERREVLEWVKSGNSVYENGYCVCEENGCAMNCLDASRFMDELIKETRELEAKDKENLHLLKMGLIDEEEYDRKRKELHPEEYMEEGQSYECFIQPVYVGAGNAKQ